MIHITSAVAELKHYFVAIYIKYFQLAITYFFLRLDFLDVNNGVLTRNAQALEILPDTVREKVYIGSFHVSLHVNENKAVTCPNHDQRSLLLAASEGWGKVMFSICSQPGLGGGVSQLGFQSLPQTLVPGSFLGRGYPSLWSHVRSGGYPSLWSHVPSGGYPSLWSHVPPRGTPVLTGGTPGQGYPLPNQDWGTPPCGTGCAAGGTPRAVSHRTFLLKGGSNQLI